MFHAHAVDAGIPCEMIMLMFHVDVCPSRRAMSMSMCDFDANVDNDIDTDVHNDIDVDSGVDVDRATPACRFQAIITRSIFPLFTRRTGHL